MKGKSHFQTGHLNQAIIKLKKSWRGKKVITLKSISLNRKVKFSQAKIDELEWMQKNNKEILN